MESLLEIPVVPFTLPLTREQFRSALHKGQGRALMHFVQHGASGFEDLIIDFCIYNRAYDTQIECDRCDWLLRMIDAAGIEPIVVESILLGFSRCDELDPSWSSWQLCRLAAMFARRGHSTARKALYGALQKSRSPDELFGLHAIIELDGADGLICVADHLGGLILASPELAVVDDPVWSYDHDHKKGDARRLLEEAATKNDRVAAYLKRLDSQDRAQRRKGTSRTLTPEQLKEITPEQLIRGVEANDPLFSPYLCQRWGRSASDESLRTVADHLFAEPDGRRRRWLLWVFKVRPLRDLDRRFVELTRDPDASTRKFAFRVLSRYRHADVRALAIERTKNNGPYEDHLLLFRENYEPGDWKFISQSMSLPNDAYDRHSMLLDLLDVFEANPSIEALDPMMVVYEHSPCGCCRGRSVELLLDLELAPAWLLVECRFDSYEGTPELLEGKKT